MPLGDFEKSILRLLAINRNPESYIAGATVFLRPEDSPRQSQDIDVFHDTVQSLQQAALQDTAVLEQNGFTPQFLLEEAQRLAHYPASRFGNLLLRQPVDPVECKRQWVRALAEAEALFSQLPPAEIGCLYLSTDDQAVTPDPSAPEFSRLRRHYGSVRGAWPAITENSV